MGRDKALIEIDGVALVDRIAATLRQGGCADVIVVGPQRLAGSNLHIDDLAPGEGPLGGILTALRAAASAGADGVFVVACDLPGLDCSTVSALLEVAGTLMPSTTGTLPSVVVARSDRLEPLCAVWSPGCSTVLQHHFDRGERSVIGALSAISTISAIEVPVDSRALRNANVPDDLVND